MNKVIVYVVPNGYFAGNLAVIYPTESSGLTIDEIASKDVPPGIPFKIIDKNDIPTNKDDTNNWKLEDL